jgi:hypothetical protein
MTGTCALATFNVGFSLRQQGILQLFVAGFSPAGEKPATIR